MSSRAPAAKGRSKNEPQSHSTEKLVYGLLVVLRLIFLALPGYIHPDEHFQNPQITGQLILSLVPTFTPWEYASETPSRSIIGPLISTGWSFWILGQLVGAGIVHLTTWSLLVASRFPGFLGSFAIDAALWKCSLTRPSRWTGLLLWASSWLALVMIQRPFGNSLITIIYALLRIYQAGIPSIGDAFVSGALSFLGIFVHFSFVLYLFPIYLLLLIGQWKTSIHSLVKYWLGWITGGILSSLICVTLDNWYYGRLEWSELILTPLNIFKYNMNTSNLALHGLHPWYLHCTVNMCLLFGPLYINWIMVNLFSGSILKKERFIFGSLVLFPLAILSLVPHQEPRFLLPLAIPIFLQTARFVRSKYFISAWILFNLATVAIFGGLHQAGLIPAIDHISKSTPKPSTIFFYKTYMPPRYLFAQQDSPTFIVPDTVGMDAEAMVGLIKSTEGDKVLVATEARANALKEYGVLLSKQQSIFPHLDLDNLDAIDIHDFKASLSLNIYSVQNHE